jgi:Na+/melibiose symporter-like transporter
LTQIAHLSMIPSLTRSKGDDVALNSIRQGMVYFASILVYIIGGLVIKNSDAGWQWEDRWSLMLIAYISIGVGFLTSLLFHVLTPEKVSDTPIMESTCQIGPNSKLTWRAWFKRPGFFRVCVCYAFTRLVYNMTLLFFPLLLSTALRYPMNYIGYCPLVLYCAAMLFSFAISPFIKLTNKKFCFIFSSLLYLGAAIWLEFLKTPNDQIWPIAILIGTSSSGILILALAAIVDVVGEHQHSSAFVYGFYSVVDKVFNGLGAVVIQLVSPCNDTATQEECTAGFASFYGRMMVIFCAIACLFYLILPDFKSDEEEMEEDESFAASHMASLIVSNRFQRSVHSSTRVYPPNSERRPLLAAE